MCDCKYVSMCVCARLPFLSHENGSLGMLGKLDKLGRVGIFAVVVFVSVAAVAIVAVVVNVAASVDVVITVELYGI